VTDWGLPDWTKQADYTALRRQLALRGRTTVWAWEFLRRSPSYREFWKDKIQPFANDDCISRDAAGNWWPYHDELKAKFGVDRPSPPQSATPAHFTANYVTWVPNDGRELQRISLDEHQIAIIIDLARPLNTQFQRARQSAEREQKYQRQAGEIAFKMARSRVDQYVTYLRILDAYEAGANPSYIANLIFPNLANEYPDCTAQKRLCDARKAALELRDGGYRSLLELR
jgi:Uncharacterized conserved protein (DUF2285)